VFSFPFSTTRSFSGGEPAVTSWGTAAALGEAETGTGGTGGTDGISETGGTDSPEAIRLIRSSIASMLTSPGWSDSRLVALLMVDQSCSTCGCQNGRTDSPKDAAVPVGFIDLPTAMNKNRVRREYRDVWSDRSAEIEFADWVGSLAGSPFEFPLFAGIA